jgi:ribosomal protein S6
LKKYEGLFILDVVGNEDAEKELIERIQKDIELAGGRVETVQKMGPKPFARISAKRSAGHYVNVIFDAPAKAIGELDAKFNLDTEMFRWQITEVIAEKIRKKKNKKDKADKVATVKA